MNRRVSVIIPARDKVNPIGSLISRIKESLSAYSYEIIVADGGSRFTVFSVVKKATLHPSFKEPQVICWASRVFGRAESKDGIGQTLVVSRKIK